MLGLNNSLCNWILDFLTGRPQSVCRPQHPEHYHTEHRCPTGMCAQPAALHAADPRLHCQVQLQPHHQVCRWHISGSLISTTMKRTTEMKWHSWLNGVVLTICPSMWEDKGGCDGLQAKLWWPPPTDHRQLDCGDSQLLQAGRRYRRIQSPLLQTAQQLFPQAVRALNSTHPAPLWSPIQTPTSWKMDNLTCSKNSHYCVYITPQKTQTSYTHPQPSAWLMMFSLHMYSICEAFVFFSSVLVTIFIYSICIVKICQ